MKSVKLLLAAVMTLILSSYCYADVGIVRIGDTDLDNAVTASDAAYLLQKTLISTFPLPAEEKYPNSFMTFSDADGDGSITASDSAAVLQKTLIGTYILPITDILKNGLYKHFSDNVNAVLSDDEEHIVISEKENDKPRILIVYFSRAGENWQVGNVEKGNTAVIEEYIKKNINADVFEIRPETSYPESYNETLSIVTRERDNNERPDYIGKIDDLDRYDTVFLGYPIWYGGLPMIMYTFLENNDLGGKTIIPFSTHGGSGWGSTLSELKKLCPNSEFKDGFSIAGTNARNTDTETKVKEWLNGIEPDKTTAEVGKFDLEKGVVHLNSGYDMPVLGIGTYMLSNEQAENSVYWALKDGYRLIDTARIYGNETGVGKGIQKAIDEGFVTREEIFVTTKMWTADFDNGESAIQASLDRLGLDYIDLMILHHSQPRNDTAAYKSMEKAVSEGKLRSIGLSNYYEPSDFDRLVNATTIKPALLQNETHPYHQSVLMKNHISQYKTVMESWFPLGGRGNTQVLFNDATISKIAAAHNKTSAQIILRWHLQAGNIAIPGSSNADHIKENSEIFDFELTDDEMQQLTALEKDERFADY